MGANSGTFEKVAIIRTIYKPRSKGGVFKTPNMIYIYRFGLYACFVGCLLAGKILYEKIKVGNTVETLIMLIFVSVLITINLILCRLTAKVSIKK